MSLVDDNKPSQTETPAVSITSSESCTPGFSSASTSSSIPVSSGSHRFGGKDVVGRYRELVRRKKASKSLPCHVSNGGAFNKDGCEKMNVDLEMPPIPNRPIDSNEEQENRGNFSSQEDWECERPQRKNLLKNQSREYLQHDLHSNSIQRVDHTEKSINDNRDESNYDDTLSENDVEVGSNQDESSSVENVNISDYDVSLKNLERDGTCNRKWDNK